MGEPYSAMYKAACNVSELEKSGDIGTVTGRHPWRLTTVSRARKRLPWWRIPGREPVMKPQFLTRAVVVPRSLFQASLSQPRFTVSKPG